MSSAATDAFVPLPIGTRAGQQQNDFRVLVAPHPVHARSLGEAVPIAATSPKPDQTSSPCQPRVSLQREGDRIIGIQIQCSCGQQIDLACAYQTP